MNSAFNVFNSLKRTIKAKSIFIQEPHENSELSFSEALCVGENAINNVDEVLGKKLSAENPEYKKLYNLYNSLISLEEEALQGSFLLEEGASEQTKQRFKYCYHQYEEIMKDITECPANALLVDDNGQNLISYYSPENLQKISRQTKEIVDASNLNLKNATYVEFVKAFAKKFELENKEIVFDASGFFGYNSLKEYFDAYIQEDSLYASRELLDNNISKVKTVKKQLNNLKNVKLYIDGIKYDIKKINNQFFEKIAEMTLINLASYSSDILEDVYGMGFDTESGLKYFNDVISECSKNSKTKTQTKEQPEQVVNIVEEKKVSNEKVDELLEDKFKNIIGLKKVKNELKDMIKLCNKLKTINKFTMAHNHMCFVGKPGTGKTTVARIVADVLYEAGFLPSNKVTEVGGISLQASYLGQTAPKVQKIVDGAKGGVLFIDEAYQITDTDRDDDTYGKEAIATLIKNMEDKKDIMVIFAGYEKPTKEMIKTNPGLESRISNTIKFDDYSEEELVQIAEIQAKANGFNLDDSSKNKLKEYFAEERKKTNFSNGRCARNIVESAEKFQSRRAGMEDFDISEMDISLAIEKQKQSEVENEENKQSAINEEAERRAEKYLISIKAQQNANQKLIEEEKKQNQNKKPKLGFGEIENS